MRKQALRFRQNGLFVDELALARFGQQSGVRRAAPDEKAETAGNLETVQARERALIIFVRLELVEKTRIEEQGGNHPLGTVVKGQLQRRLDGGKQLGKARRRSLVDGPTP